MENTNNNTTNEEDTRDTTRAGETRIEIEDEEIARRGTSTGGRAVGEAGGGGAPAEDEEIARRGAYGSEAIQSPRIGTSTGGAGANGGATPIMDTIHINSSIEDRIRILSTEMIRRGLETEESFKRLRSYEKQRNDYRCLMEELARYYDRQTALGLPIEQLVLKTGVYMQHIILV